MQHDGPTMRFFYWLSQIFGGNTVAQQAQAIAARCHPVVLLASVDTATSMSVHEARGYIRAKATPVVRNEVDLHLREQRRAAGGGRARLLELVSSRVVASVLREVLAARRHRADRLRRAA